MPKSFLIVGPEDHNHLPTFWNKDCWQWVERGKATLYTGANVFSFPPRELPIGARGIIDLETACFYTVPLGGGSED